MIHFGNICVQQILSGHSRDVAHFASEKVDDASEGADAKKAHAWSWGSHKVDETKGSAEEARQFAEAEGASTGGKARIESEKIRGEL